MGDFTLDDFTAAWEEGGSYRDLCISYTALEHNFAWWCLGHNFDVVACIISMANLSWEKGWNARDAICSFCTDLTDCYPNPENR